MSRRRIKRKHCLDVEFAPKSMDISSITKCNHKFPSPSLVLPFSKKELEGSLQLNIPIDLYHFLDKKNNLKICLPEEECSLYPLDKLLGQILEKYDGQINGLITIRTPVVKKDKEHFIACLYAYIVRDLKKRQIQMDVCIPKEDRGTDVYIRETDYSNQRFYHRPIQICEMPDKFLVNHNYPKEPTERVFHFVKEKKLSHSPKANPDSLLIWLETEQSIKLDIQRLRGLMEQQPQIPFSNIVLMSIADKKHCISLASIYSRDKRYQFCTKYNIKTRQRDLG
jgi:hypothetical protein